MRVRDVFFTHDKFRRRFKDGRCIKDTVQLLQTNPDAIQRFPPVTYSGTMGDTIALNTTRETTNPLFLELESGPFRVVTTLICSLESFVKRKSR